MMRRMRSVLEEQLVDQPCEPAPALRLLRQGAFAGARQRVELGFAVGFRPAPAALYPALLLHADERGIERALVERERMVRDLRETGGERVGMKRPHRGQGAQDDQIERALQQLDVLVSTGHASGECQPFARMSSGAPTPRRSTISNPHPCEVSMFERFTEQARRIVFFARYEASQLGSIDIDTEHVLLGLIRHTTTSRPSTCCSDCSAKKPLSLPTC